MRADPSNGRLTGLDALRGLAVMSVMTYHYTVPYVALAGHPLPLLFNFIYGHYGVELFFVISGFVIFLTLQRTSRPQDFIVSRMARLYPTFVTAMLLTATIMHFSSFDALKVGIGPMLVNLSMLAPLLGVPSVDGAYWSLVPEIAFYLLAGVAYFGLRSFRIETLSIAWLALAVLLHVTGINRDPAHSAPFFVIGMMLYRLRSGEGGPLTLATLGIALLASACGAGDDLWPIPAAVYVMLIACFAALVWLGSAPRSPLARLSPLVFIGEISYALYLIHQYVGFVVIDHLVRWGVEINTAAVLAMGVCILLAYAITRFVERPAQRALRAAFARGSRPAVNAFP